MREDGAITKKCPKCGSEFLCYSQSNQKCWCDNFFVDATNLKLLADKYKGCLCPECLNLYGKKKS